MCVIVYKPLNVEIPPEDVLRECWNRNSDGSGFMYQDKDEGVIIQKGYMDFESLINDLNLLKKEFKDDTLKCINLVIHFRLTSHGITSKNFTHPFPITDQKHSLKSSLNYVDKAVCHNGTINSVRYHDVFSDTFILTHDILSQFKEINQDIINFISESTGSKYCYMDKDQVLLGGLFTEYMDCKFSNLYFISSYTSSNKKYEDYKCEYYEDLADELYDKIDSWINEDIIIIYGNYYDGLILSQDELDIINDIKKDETRWEQLKNFYKFYYCGEGY